CRRLDMMIKRADTSATGLCGWQDTKVTMAGIAWMLLISLVENDCLVSVKEDAILDVPAHGTRQDYLLQVAAFLQQVVEGVAVRDADYVLLDDWAIVQNLGDVVAGRTNEFHPAGEGLVIRLGANERRQERMMNVNDAVRVLVDEF